VHKTSVSKEGLALASCGLGIVGSFTDSIGLTNIEDREEAEAAHQAWLAEMELNLAEDLCFNDAELELVGLRTASLRSQRASEELSQALFRLEQDISSAQSAYDAGRAALVIAQSQALRPPSHDFWFDEEVSTYLSRMKVARRVVYLSVRAVEFEYQASLSARQDVLSAEVPADLETVIQELRSISAPRSIAGSRPTDLKAVLSLKNDILQLVDASGSVPAGWQNFTDTEKLRALFSADELAVYDEETGDHLGQRIPFSLAPLGALGLGDVGGVPLLAANDCAERLWGISSSIVGSDLYRGDAPTFVRIDVLKSNAFFSQWCDESRTGFQDASVRPSRNLFREPGQQDAFGQQLGGSSGRDDFGRARLEAYLNVDRAELEQDEYASGASSELAARGLYGEYALFIPEAIISRSESEDGLVVDRIDDILIRFDYVSVAR
jgi:hypothetical protein